jgi:hypothetical protein
MYQRSLRSLDALAKVAKPSCEQTSSKYYNYEGNFDFNKSSIEQSHNLVAISLGTVNTPDMLPRVQETAV